MDQYRIRGHSGYLLAGERNCTVRSYEGGSAKGPQMRRGEEKVVWGNMSKKD